MLSDEQLMDAAAEGGSMIAALRAVEAAVRADQIEKTIDAAGGIAQSQYDKGHTESAFGANLVREHFAAIRAQLTEGNTDE